MARRDMDRLKVSMRWSRQAMLRYRQKRLEMVRIVLGGHWNEASVPDRQPLNMIELTLRVWTRNLIARAPKARVVARRKQSRPLAKSFELVMDDVVREMALGKSLEAVVVDAMWSPMSVMKCGITESGLNEAMGALHDAGLPYADPVDFEDLVVDMAANDWESMQYVGNRYVMPREALLGSKLFKVKERDLAETANPVFYGEFGEERTQDLQKQGVGWSGDRFAEPMVQLQDVWMTRDRCMYTFVLDDGGQVIGDAIREAELDCPEEGPYVQLKYGKGRMLMGLPPLANLRDLSDAMNASFRKLMRQQARQKVVGIVQSGNDKDATTIRDASDGEIVPVERPGDAREMKFGGIDQASLAFAMQMKDMFSFLAGNLVAQGGLGEVADTLGQDEMIRASASQTIADMQATTVEFAKRVLRQVATYVWYDPERTYLVEKPIGDSGITIPVDVKPSDREEASWLEMEFDIVPGSMQEESNAQRLKSLMGAFDKLTQAYPAIQQQGLQLDMKGFNDRVAELSNNPDIADLLVPAGMPPMPQGMGQDAEGVGGVPPGGAPPGQMVRSPPMAPTTRREYIRKSTATGGTPEARSTVLQQALSGKGVTPQNAGLLSRNS